jgi:type I restriction enzyme M protein
MAKAKKTGKKKNRKIDSQSALNQALWKGVCDILRRDKCKSAVQYVPEVAWMLFLCVLDQREEVEAERGRAQNLPFTPSLSAPYRWRDWAKADGTLRAGGDSASLLNQLFTEEEQEDLETQERENPFRTWVNRKLFQHLRRLGEQPSATLRQKIISRIFINKERTLVAADANLLEALDEIDHLAGAEISEQHMFLLSQAFEGLLPRMGEKKNDGGQFFTPREVARIIVEAVDPQVGKTVYDPCCGTGGFLIEAFKHLSQQHPSGKQIEDLKSETLWGREDENLAIPITLANMVLHGVDYPHIWHGNTLTGAVTYAGLFEGAPQQFDYIFTNPPFGSKESKQAQAQFTYKTNKAQILFLQHIIDSLAEGGTCGMVIDEGVLFHTNTEAFWKTKAKLLRECDLWCVVSLPPNVFVNAGAASKTDLLFFTKGKATERIWFYDLADRHVTKKNPMKLGDFKDFLERLRLSPEDPERVSERSWWVDITELREHKKQEAVPFKGAASAARQEEARLKSEAKEIKKAIKEAERNGAPTTVLEAQLEACEASIKQNADIARANEARAKAIEESLYELKATNPNAPDTSDKRTRAELLAIIRKANEEIARGLTALELATPETLEEASETFVLTSPA